MKLSMSMPLPIKIQIFAKMMIPTRKGAGVQDWNHNPSYTGKDRISFCIKDCDKRIWSGSILPAGVAMKPVRHYLRYHQRCYIHHVSRQRLYWAVLGLIHRTLPSGGRMQPDSVL